MEQTRQRADMQHSFFIGETELKGYINASYKELYDVLTSRFEDYYSEREVFTLTSGNTHPLPDDFYKLRGMDLQIADQAWVTMDKFNFNDRNAINNATVWPFYYVYNYQVMYRVMADNIEFLPIQNALQTYRLWYIPKAQDLAEGVDSSLEEQDITFTSSDAYEDVNSITVAYTGGGTAGAEVVTVTDLAISVQIQSGVSTATQIKAALDASSDATDLISVAITGTASTAQVTFSATALSGGTQQVDMNGVNGWEDYVVVDAAIKCLVKEESDPRALMEQKQGLLKRIEAMAANRDAGKPEKITDVSKQNWPWRNGGGLS